MSYIITVAVNIAIFALLALSLNIITGYADSRPWATPPFWNQCVYGCADDECRNQFLAESASSNAGHGSGRRAARCNQPQGKR